MKAVHGRGGEGKKADSTWRRAKWEKLRVGFLLTPLEFVCSCNRCSFKQQLSLWMDVHAASYQAQQRITRKVNNISLLDESINNSLALFRKAGSSFKSVKWLLGSGSMKGPTSDGLFLTCVESRRMRTTAALPDNVLAFFILMKRTARSAD